MSSISVVLYCFKTFHTEETFVADKFSCLIDKNILTTLDGLKAWETEFGRLAEELELFFFLLPLPPEPPPDPPTESGPPPEEFWLELGPFVAPGLLLDPDPVPPPPPAALEFFRFLRDFEFGRELLSGTALTKMLKGDLLILHT